MSIASESPVTPTAIALLADVECPPPEVSWDSLKRFTVDEYHAMIDAGVFAEDENFELLEGLIVRKMTKNPPHWIACGALRDALIELRIPGFFVHSQEPVTTDVKSEPEPDIALIRGHRRDYGGRNPDPKQAPLVIEVADSSLAHDRRWKKRIYARAGIPVYWIVNLIDRQVEIFTKPTGPAKQPDYAQCDVVPADGIVPVMIDGREMGRLSVRDFLP
jgi:Uma2 family endonuclease